LGVKLSGKVILLILVFILLVIFSTCVLFLEAPKEEQNLKNETPILYAETPVLGGETPFQIEEVFLESGAVDCKNLNENSVKFSYFSIINNNVSFCDKINVTFQKNDCITGYYTLNAYLSGDTELCDKISNSDDLNLCKAITEKNDNFCSLVSKNKIESCKSLILALAGNQSGLSKNNLYHDDYFILVAIKNDNPDLCKNILGYINGVQDIIFKSSRIYRCENIINKDYNKLKRDLDIVCEDGSNLKLAILLGNISTCNKIVDNKIKLFCSDILESHLVEICRNLTDYREMVNCFYSNTNLTILSNRAVDFYFLTQARIYANETICQRIDDKNIKSQCISLSK